MKNEHKSIIKYKLIQKSYIWYLNSTNVSYKGYFRHILGTYLHKSDLINKGNSSTELFKSHKSIESRQIRVSIKNRGTTTTIRGKTNAYTHGIITLVIDFPIFFGLYNFLECFKCICQSFQFGRPITIHLFLLK